MSLKYDKYFNHLSIIIAKNDSEAVILESLEEIDSTKQSEMSGTDNRASQLRLYKVDNNLKGINTVR